MSTGVAAHARLNRLTPVTVPTSNLYRSIEPVRKTLAVFHRTTPNGPMTSPARCTINGCSQIAAGTS